MAENKNIYGNTAGVRTQLLERLEGFAEHVYSPGSFIPEEILLMMTEATCETNKEVAVFLDRKNRVLAIALGSDKSVPLPELEGRKSFLSPFRNPLPSHTPERHHSSVGYRSAIA